MTPKFLELTRASNGEKVMVNPRRADMFHAVRHPSAQPDLKGKCGTIFAFGPRAELVVKESVETIKSMLK